MEQKNNDIATSNMVDAIEKSLNAPNETTEEQAESQPDSGAEKNEAELNTSTSPNELAALQKQLAKYEAKEREREAKAKAAKEKRMKAEGKLQELLEAKETELNTFKSTVKGKAKETFVTLQLQGAGFNGKQIEKILPSILATAELTVTDELNVVGTVDSQISEWSETFGISTDSATKPAEEKKSETPEQLTQPQQPTTEQMMQQMMLRMFGGQVLAGNLTPQRKLGTREVMVQDIANALNKG